MSASGLRIVSRLPLVVREGVPGDGAEEYVAAHPRACSYHRRAWLDVIRASFGHQTRYLVAQTSHGIAGVLPLVFFRSRLFGRFTVSMPFLNYGGVLADTGDAARTLLQHAIEETTNAGGSHLELRHTEQLFTELTPKRHKVAMELSLVADVEKHWEGLDRKVRNQVRKAEKHGLQPVTGGAELLDQFYEVFAHNMRDLGTPVYGRRFFAEILSTFPAETRLFVVLADGRPAAASFVHWYRDVIQVPWASAIREFNPLCANVLLYWHMGRFAVERGFRTFDFGRSTPNEGTYHFKKQWGAVPRELVWEYWTPEGRSLPELNPKNPKFDLAIRTWQRLPLRVANTLGPFVVRNIP
jgi:FemAB-related protein (PEP-CTERM system-associated)